MVYLTFNFFASQLRMRVEMAFGMFTNKWAILQRSLLNGLGTDKLIVLTLARPHNYCINERLAMNDWDPVVAYPHLVEEALIEADDEYPDIAADDLEGVAEGALEGTSFTRVQMKQIIKEKGLARPVRNLVRNDNN
jgi:hypothetical protein